MRDIHRSSFSIIAEGTVYRSMLESHRQELFKGTESVLPDTVKDPAMKPWKATIGEHHHGLAIEGITRADHPTLGIADILESSMHHLGITAFMQLDKSNSVYESDQWAVCKEVCKAHGLSVDTNVNQLLYDEQLQLEKSHELVYSWPMSVPLLERGEVFCYTLDHMLSKLKTDSQRTPSIDHVLHMLPQDHSIRQLELKQVPCKLQELMQDPTSSWKLEQMSKWSIDPHLQYPQLFHQHSGLLVEELVHPIWHLYRITYQIDMLKVAFAEELTLNENEIWKGNSTQMIDLMSTTLHTSHHLWSSTATLIGHLGDVYSPVLQGTQEEKGCELLKVSEWHADTLMDGATNPLAPTVEEYDIQGLCALLIDAFYSQIKLPTTSLTPMLQKQLAIVHNDARIPHGQTLLGTGPGNKRHAKESATVASCILIPWLQRANHSTEHCKVWDSPHMYTYVQAGQIAV